MNARVSSELSDVGAEAGGLGVKGGAAALIGGIGLGVKGGAAALIGGIGLGVKGGAAALIGGIGLGDGALLGGIGG